MQELIRELGAAEIAAVAGGADALVVNPVAPFQLWPSAIRPQPEPWRMAPPIVVGGP